MNNVPKWKLAFNTAYLVGNGALIATVVLLASADKILKQIGHWEAIEKVTTCPIASLGALTAALWLGFFYLCELTDRLYSERGEVSAPRP